MFSAKKSAKCHNWQHPESILTIVIHCQAWITRALYRTVGWKGFVVMMILALVEQFSGTEPWPIFGNLLDWKITKSCMKSLQCRNLDGRILVFSWNVWDTLDYMTWLAGEVYSVRIEYLFSYLHQQRTLFFFANAWCMIGLPLAEISWVREMPTK